MNISILNLFLKKKGVGGLRILFSFKKFQTQIMSNILKTENINTINTTKRISHIYWHNGTFFFVKRIKTYPIVKKSFYSNAFQF